MIVTVNGVRVMRARVVLPWTGVWFAELELDVDIAATMPTSGPAVLVVDATPTGPLVTLKGTIDAKGTGTFVSVAKMRVLGGAGSWGSAVPAQHFQSDAGVADSSVEVTTGILAKETVTDPVPSIVGTDYARSAGPASRVLDDLAWWVDPVTGVTFVGVRPPAVPDPSLTILEWDPLEQTGHLTCDTLVLPGTLLVDARIPGSPVTVRDVEQVFSADGSSVQVWCAGAAVARLQVALTTLVRELARTQYLRPFSGRIVGPAPDGSGRYLVQAVSRDGTGAASPMPDLSPAEVWAGMQGDSAVLKPSAELLVDFADGNPAKPRIRGFAPGAIPIKRTVDASAEVDVGPSAALVALAGGAAALATGPWATAVFGALKGFATSLSSASSIADVAAAGAALSTALNIPLFPAPATLKTKAT